MPTLTRKPFPRLVAMTAILFVLGLGHAIQDASASHLRYSSISAQAIGETAYAVTFSEGQAGCASVGNSFAALTLFYGDGTSAFPTATVASLCVAPASTSGTTGRALSRRRTPQD